MMNAVMKVTMVGREGREERRGVCGVSLKNLRMKWQLERDKYSGKE